MCSCLMLFVKTLPMSVATIHKINRNIYEEIILIEKMPSFETCPLEVMLIHRPRGVIHLFLYDRNIHFMRFSALKLYP